MEWNNERKYRPYDQWSEAEKQQLKEKVATSKWRHTYHLQPETGLLNDPNGFSYFNNQWHLFYQYFPFGPIHGLKSWYHVVSDDLIHWQPKGIGILPDTPYDSHGAYSGSALAVDDQLFIAYTGNVRDENWRRVPYQLSAWMDKKGQISKNETPLLSGSPEGITEHFRDPQVFQYGDKYLMLVGAQTDELQGAIAVYQSEDLQAWKDKGFLKFSHESMGFMIECPNLLFIEEQPVLIFCPQGVEKKLADYQNIYPNFYVVGERFDEEGNKIEGASSLKQMDEGFDLYATQAFTAPDGRHLSVGWIGLPEMKYPTFEEGWAHCLSLVKELSLKEGVLYQYPVVETKQLRNTAKSRKGSTNALTVDKTTNSYELQLKIPANSSGEVRLFSDEAGHSLSLTFDSSLGEICLDRSQTAYPLNVDYGTIRKVLLEKGQKITLSIFLDQSVCEIFINEGRHVLTSNYYPTQKQNKLSFEGNQTIAFAYYPLEKNV